MKRVVPFILFIVVLTSIGSCNPYPPYESDCKLCIFKMEEQYLDHIIVDLINDSTGVIWCADGQVYEGGITPTKEPYQAWTGDLTSEKVSKISATPLHGDYYTYIDNPTIGTRKAVLIDCKWVDFDKISYMYLVQKHQLDGGWITDTTYHNANTTPSIIGPAFSEMCVLPGTMFVKNSQGEFINSKEELIDKINHWIDLEKVQNHSAEGYDCYWGISSLYTTDFSVKIIIPLKH